MAERPAVNASPLILLARAGLLEFLQLAGAEIVVPSAVADEIRREGPNDPAVRALEATGWLKVVEVPPLPAVIQGWDLGAGESAVLAGRRCAAALRIPVRGTLGLVLVAKQRGQIKAARPILESMRASGMYLSDGVMNRTLALIGEQAGPRQRVLQESTLTLSVEGDVRSLGALAKRTEKMAWRRPLEIVAEEAGKRAVAAAPEA